VQPHGLCSAWGCAVFTMQDGCRPTNALSDQSALQRTRGRQPHCDTVGLLQDAKRATCVMALRCNTVCYIAIV
jgi:hypothetical protein